MRPAASAPVWNYTASTCSYSLAVLDLGLPDQDGFVLAEYLRKNTSMWIIILSARDAINDNFVNGAAEIIPISRQGKRQDLHPH